MSSNLKLYFKQTNYSLNFIFYTLPNFESLMFRCFLFIENHWKEKFALKS